MNNSENTQEAAAKTEKQTEAHKAAASRVEQMYEYGYRKSNYGPDELVTDAHGNPISVMDAMLSADDAALSLIHI